jgi:hypothetical protein
MTDDEKQIELEKNRILLLGTLDYHLEYYIGSMVFDQWDPAAEFYLQEKQKTENDYQESRLEMLQVRLHKLTSRLRDRTDLNFEGYIKKQTGYTIDIFEELRNDVASIVSKGKIENDDELKSVASMIKVYQHESVAREQIDLLINLTDEFAKSKQPNKIVGEADFSEVKHVIAEFKVPQPNSETTVMTDTASISRIISGAELATFQRNNGLLSEHHSPDSRRHIMIRTNGVEKNALTEVSIILKGGSGCIYCARGLGLPIKAYWKDNVNVVIETKKEYSIEVKYHTVRSFEDVVKIEYQES